MLFPPKRGRYINHIKQSYFLTATQMKLKKGNTLLSRSIVHKVIHLTLSLILESLPGNLPVLLKSKQYVLNYKRLQGHFCGKFRLSFAKKKKTKKHNLQRYKNPFGNNIFLSLLSTFQQSLIATVPRSCLHPALKEYWGASGSASKRKSSTASFRYLEKQTKERIFSAACRSNRFSKQIHLKTPGAQGLVLWDFSGSLNYTQSSLRLLSFVPPVFTPRIKKGQNAK